MNCPKCSGGLVEAYEAPNYNFSPVTRVGAEIPYSIVMTWKTVYHCNTCSISVHEKHKQIYVADVIDELRRQPDGENMDTE